jgi:hypothetical protein
LLVLLCSCGGDSSNDGGLTENISQEPQSKHIKALFFGTGPYSAPGNDYQFVVKEMDKINTAVAGYFTTVVVQSEKTDLTNPQENQVTFNFVDHYSLAPQVLFT